MEPTSPTPQKHASSSIIWIAIIGIILIAGIMYLVYNQSAATKKTDQPSTTTTETSASPSAASISSDTDLQAASTELDKVDLDSVDSGLTQNDSEAANF
jgi:flagellar basal body-associated protein FliL